MTTIKYSEEAMYALHLATKRFLDACNAHIMQYESHIKCTEANGSAKYTQPFLEEARLKVAWASEAYAKALLNAGLHPDQELIEEKRKEDQLRVKKLQAQLRTGFI